MFGYGKSNQETTVSTAAVVLAVAKMEVKTTLIVEKTRTIPSGQRASWLILTSTGPQLGESNGI